MDFKPIFPYYTSISVIPDCSYPLDCLVEVFYMCYLLFHNK